MKSLLATALLSVMTVTAHAQAPEPTWQLGTDSIDPKLTKDTVSLVDGVVKVDGANTFAIPASLLGDQNDYTIEFEVRRPAETKSGHGIALLSNCDEEKKAGIKLDYYPPEYNCGWLSCNGHRTFEQRGLLREAFTKITFVVKDRQLSLFRNGLILAITDKVTPSALPLTFGGSVHDKRPPQSYELRNITVYDTAIFPTGFDSSVARMRNYSGDQYFMQRVDVEDPSLPRILVVGDSISMGYRGFIAEHFKGRAYVDYWVGGGWFAWTVKKDDFPLLRGWDGVLSNGPYDVVSWNSMTLHMRNTQESRCPEETLEPNMTRVVQHLKKTAPKTQFMWIRCTPWRNCLEDGTHSLENPVNARIIRFNRIVDSVMRKEGIPEVDLYAIAERQLHTIKKGSSDTVHWGKDVSRLFADAIIKEIEKHLPKKEIEGKQAS